MNTDFKQQYIDWLYENIDQKKVSDNTYSITLPFLDRNNDHLQVFIICNPDQSYTLTDDGETVAELELSGMDVMASDRRKTIFNTILRSHGVTCTEDKALCVQCTNEDLPLKKHMLTQCMIKISDMFYLARPNIQSLFIEDVKAYFEKNEIFGIGDVSFSGKSGLITTYDFGISRSKKAPERLVKVVNTMNLLNAQSIAFLWEDTRIVRPEVSLLYVFIQDKLQKIPHSATHLMEQYGIKPVLWSQRDNYISELAA